ncbi:MAG TPA: alpha/beta hydrolase, partial [Gemmatimonadales bacterium]|nr:alpha/beta hydrolase [Gemmatimonadales bacterium]
MALRFLTASLAAGLLITTPAAAQTSVADWTATLANDLRVVTGVTYLRASNWESTLDVYTPRAPGPHPTVIQIHGGGWVAGSREGTLLRALPYLEMGFAVVNISYRLGPVAEAPAAVEDTLCAVRWVVRNAKEYGFDPSRIVATGYSAGGHLALAAGIIPASAGLDRRCPGQEPIRVAAVVNWYGITDVADLIEGPNTRSYAVEWMGSAPNRAE